MQKYNETYQNKPVDINAKIQTRSIQVKLIALEVVNATIPELTRIALAETSSSI